MPNISSVCTKFDLSSADKMGAPAHQDLVASQAMLLARLLAYEVRHTGATPDAPNSQPFIA
jgi:hypothetical protein